MNDHVVKIIAEGLDEASGPIGNVTGALSGLGGVASTVATGGLALVGVGLAAIVAGVGAVGAAVWNFSSDSSDAMRLFGAQTGLAGDTLIEMRDTARDVWAAGVGESIGEVTEQMSLVYRAFGETGEQLEDSTRRAMTFARVFEIDVAESTRTVSSMMASWGITSEEAFDIMTTGAQMGLDRMGDLADTLHEYSGDFERLGFTAEQTLTILNAGLEEGAYNTDVIADGFREMNIRLLEGGDAVTEAFDQMGLDFAGLQDAVAAGDATWSNYTRIIIENLMAIESEVERNAAGIAIFGTKWEDLGGDIFLAAGMATEGVGDIAGATDAMADSMDVGFTAALERLKRSVVVNLAPLGDYAGGMLDDMSPYLEDAAAWLGENIPLAIAYLEEKWLEYWPIARDAVLEWWADTKPTLEDARDMLVEFTTTFVPRFAESWGLLHDDALPETTDSINDDLLPALNDLMIALGIVDTDATDWGITLADVAAWVVTLTEWVGKQNLTSAIQTLTAVTWYVTDQFSLFKTLIKDTALAMLRAIKISTEISGAFGNLWSRVGGLVGMVKGFIEVLHRLRDALGNLSLPDWLTPGSPTPFELGLLGINEALATMPDLTTTFEVSSVSIPRVGESRTRVIEIHNHFGRDSVRSDQDILDIADATRDAWQLRGIQPAL